jgi:putative Mg2+ transporter-C (MgtC) family protein
MDWTEFAIRLGVAFGLGSAIGLERQISHRMAGLKTNALVATGACLFMLLGDSFSSESNSRVAAQIISGIGFLGGGVILRDGLHVRGLNTAATLWCAAAVGTLSGSGLLTQAAVGTGAVLLINIGLRPIAERIGEGGLTGFDSGYLVRVICRIENEHAVRGRLLELAQEAKMQIRALKMEAAGTDAVALEAELRPLVRNGSRLEELVNMTSRLEGVNSVEWRALA